MGNQQLSPDEGKAQRPSQERVDESRKGGSNVEKIVNKPCRLTTQEQNRIIFLYTQNHLSIVEIARQTHHKQSTVSKVLHNNGIDIKLGLPKYIPSERELEIIKDILVNNHGNYKEAGKAIGKDWSIIKRIASEYHIPYDYRPYNKNLRHDFFDTIDTPEKAWLLGFLFTDGSVRKIKKSCYQIRLSIQLKDEEMIDRIMQWLNIDTKKKYDRREGKETVGIEVLSENMYNQLQKYGIVPNKTYIVDRLYIDDIPEKFRRDYIRGLFDGDGGISFTGNTAEVSCNFTSYFYNTVKEFQFVIDENIGKMEHNSIKTDDGRSICSWRGRQQVLKILSWLYDDAKVYLPRKYQKYLWIKSTL